MLLFLTVAAIVSIGLAGWNFYAVLDELRRRLPGQFTEEELRWAIRYHIWSPVASGAARLRFVWVHLWGSLGSLFLSAALWLSGHLIGAAVLGAAAVLGVAYIGWQSYRYRLRAPQNSN